jgi:hypothetical protein
MPLEAKEKTGWSTGPSRLLLFLIRIRPLARCVKHAVAGVFLTTATASR